MIKNSLIALMALVFAFTCPMPSAIAGPASKLIVEQSGLVNFEAIELALGDAALNYPQKYPDIKLDLAKLREYQKSWSKVLEGLKKSDPQAIKHAAEVIEFKRKILLSNELMDFDKLLIIQRSGRNLGLPRNWQGNSDLRPKVYDNEIAILSDLVGVGKLRTLYKPEDGSFVGDVDLDFDAKRMLFSMPGKDNRWQIFEIDTDGSNLRQMPLIDYPGVHNYDACYLPDGNVIFNSTAPFVGVPCVKGSSHVTNLYLKKASDGSIRRLTFEQDHDWCPTVMDNGKILYLRWEYSDIPHYVSRILFHMNPDGTEQMAFYGSNSYWPNSMFYARPVPGSTSKFVAIVGGHHDVPRMGELVLFDTARGRREADGVIQRITQRGKKVQPIIRDGLVGSSWPKFLHPWPLSEKYFLTACKPTPQSNWGIYLADVFDNVTLIKEVPGYALLEPVPLRPRKRPPLIPEKVDTSRKNAVAYIADIYEGPGLKGVPVGTVKKLRLFTYHFAYHGMGGQQNRVGYDGPWDIKRIIGTVPVEKDGSALFEVPANTPVSIQPLDEDGKAIQLMRSWFTAMPGEVVSCVGCHERQNTAPKRSLTIASRKAPSKIKPWYGPTRGFSFIREVQPVLDKYCVKCHNSGDKAKAKGLDNFEHAAEVVSKYGARFTPAYRKLYSYVRSHTMESDIHLLNPYEFHADTTRLVQLLESGHHGVILSSEAWDRLITWIDLNTPAHGTWAEIVGGKKVQAQNNHRRQMLMQYANIDEMPEEKIKSAKIKEDNLVIPKFLIDKNTLLLSTVNSPINKPITKILTIADGIKLTLVKISPDLWMSSFEITNKQFALFDPDHDSRLEHGEFLQFSVAERGYPVNADNQPVVRVSLEEAMRYCKWLSEKTGLEFTLPTETQWQQACRASTDTPLWFGKTDSDFSKFANLADKSFKRVDSFRPWKLPAGALEELRPAVDKFDDGHKVSAPVGSYKPNPLGLYDMHGNVAEWTLTSPVGDKNRRIVCGGSWYDRPENATVTSKKYYLKWAGVYDVGFRVVLTGLQDKN